jgi:DNA repair protein RadC
MERRHQPPVPEQSSFLAPEDADLVHLMRRFLAEASRIYEVHGRPAPASEVQILVPRDAYEYLRAEMEGLAQEQIRVITLTSRNTVLSAPMIYQGSVSNVHVRVAEIFRPAIIQNAPAILVAHNHPSGDPTPSADDISLTRQLVDAGRLLDVDVLDHLVIGDKRWASLRERGLGFGPASSSKGGGDW